MEFIAEYWLATLFGGVVGCMGVLFRKMQTARQEQESVRLGVQALLRDRIVKAYYHYKESNNEITLHGLENVIALYEQYHALGGNGTVTKLVEELKNMRISDGVKKEKTT